MSQRKESRVMPGSSLTFIWTKRHYKGEGTLKENLESSAGGNSLAVQGLRLWLPNAGSTGSIPGWGTKIQLAMWSGQKKEMLETNTTITEIRMPLMDSLVDWAWLRKESLSLRTSIEISKMEKQREKTKTKMGMGRCRTSKNRGKL